MRILITGCAGFIGTNLGLSLLADGHELIGIDSFDPYYSPKLKQKNAADLEKQGAELIVADLTTLDPSAYPGGINAVLHLAAQPGISPDSTFDSYLRNNLIATQCLLEACKGFSDLSHFVYCSTSSVYGIDASCSEKVAPRPASHYGVSKLAAEQLCLAAHRQGELPVSVARLFSVYGPRERPDKLIPKLLKALINDEPFTLCDGSKTHMRSYTFVNDIVDGFKAVLDKPDVSIGEIFNFGNPHSVSTGHAMETAERCLNKQLKVVVIPPRKGDQLITEAITEKASRMLGYHPRTDLESGLSTTAEWFRSNSET